MMTEQERLEEFLKAYQALTVEYGVQLVALPNIRRYGDMLQIDKPSLEPAFVKDWQPPQPEAPTGTQDDPLPTPPFQPPKVMNMVLEKESANGDGSI